MIVSRRVPAAASWARQTWTSRRSNSGRSLREIARTSASSLSVGASAWPSIAPIMISACHWASLAVVWPSALAIRTTVVSSISSPPSMPATRRSASTSASVKAGVSSAGVANPSARQMRWASSEETPARLATSPRV